MIPELLGLELGLLGTVIFYGLLGAGALWLGRFLYEIAADDEGIAESFQDSTEWFGAMVGAVAGVVALVLVEGVDVIAMAVDFVASHALGFVAAVLTGLAAALAEGFVSLNGTTVIGIAIALTGLAMLSSRWVDDWG